MSILVSLGILVVSIILWLFAPKIKEWMQNSLDEDEALKFIDENRGTFEFYYQKLGLIEEKVNTVGLLILRNQPSDYDEDLTKDLRTRVKTLAIRGLKLSEDLAWKDNDAPMSLKKLQAIATDISDFISAYCLAANLAYRNSFNINGMFCIKDDKGA